MIKKMKSLIAGVFLLLVLATPALAPAVASAAGCPTTTGTGSISENVSGGVSCTDPNAAPTVSATERVTGIAQQVIRIFSYVVGIISVIMVIVGGFQYVTSGGDSGKVTTAKNTIMYALIGIVIVALSQIMVNFVLEKFVG